MNLRSFIRKASRSLVAFTDGLDEEMTPDQYLCWPETAENDVGSSLASVTIALWRIKAVVAAGVLNWELGASCPGLYVYYFRSIFMISRYTSYVFQSRTFFIFLREGGDSHTM